MEMTWSKWSGNKQGKGNNSDAVMCQTSIQNELLFQSSARLIALNKKRDSKEAHNE